MNYNFHLAPVTISTPPNQTLVCTLLSQFESWTFDPQDRACEINITMCPVSFSRLQRIDFSLLRPLLHISRQIHPDATLNFFSYTSPSPICSQSGLKGIN